MLAVFKFFTKDITRFRNGLYFSLRGVSIIPAI